MAFRGFATRLALLATLLWVASAAPAPKPAAGAPVFTRIDELLSQLSEMTGLQAKHRVPHTIIDRDGLKRFLEGRVHEEIKPEEIRIEELLLEKLGFVPPAFDLKKTMIELYTEQAAAFYDFHKKRLFLLESGDSKLDEAALFHELAHALADQHFHLARFLDEAGQNDDGALARMAVMEGQATWLMSELIVRRTGQSLKGSPKTVDLMSRMTRASAGQFPVFDQAPLYIRESLMFPYSSGFKFQNAVIERYGNAGFAMVFRRPPATTREVMHPEVYFEHPRRKTLALPRLNGRRRFRKLAEGTLGEFDYSILIRQFGDDAMARRLAPAWRAGSYRLLERKKKKGAVLMHASEWASPEKAREFFEFLEKALGAKWKSMKVNRRSADRIEGTGDDGSFVLRIAGSTVYSIEGLASPDEIRKWPQR